MKIEELEHLVRENSLVRLLLNKRELADLISVLDPLSLLKLQDADFIKRRGLLLVQLHDIFVKTYGDNDE